MESVVYSRPSIAVLGAWRTDRCHQAQRVQKAMLVPQEQGYWLFEDDLPKKSTLDTVNMSLIRVPRAFQDNPVFPACLDYADWRALPVSLARQELRAPREIRGSEGRITSLKTSAT